MSAMSEIATELDVNWGPPEYETAISYSRYHTSGKWMIYSTPHQQWLYHWDGEGWAYVMSAELPTTVLHVSLVEPIRV